MKTAHPCTDLDAGDLTRLIPRALHFGISWGELQEAMDGASSWEEWGRRLSALAEAHEARGDEAHREGREHTAVAAWQAAAACFHFAQIRSVDEAIKAELQNGCRRAYARTAPLFVPGAERVMVPFGAARLPGYLRVSRPGAPCVLMINGLDSAKEVEVAAFAEGFLARGASVFSFDGPGQGELSGELPMTLQFEDAVRAAREHLEQDPRVKGAPMGIFGVSFGGYLACRAAATEPAIRACVSLGGFFDGSVLGRLGPIGSANLRRAFGLGISEPLDAVREALTLRPLEGLMNRPLLVVHGREDHLVGLAQIEAMRAWGGPRTTTWILDGADHVCQNRFSICLPAVWDWMIAELRSAGGSDRGAGS